MDDAEVYFTPAFFKAEESNAYLADLLKNARWSQEKIRWYGKTLDLPRLTAWYGDEGKVYKYSGITVVPDPWTPTLLKIKDAIEQVSGLVFNSVLLNLYRDGKDSVAWHSDDEPELGPEPTIGSVSLGEARVFKFRHKRDKAIQASVMLTHGSYLLMKGRTQEAWIHEIPKTSRAISPRINLTFRFIKETSAATGARRNTGSSIQSGRDGV